MITAAVYYYFVDSRLAGLLCILLFSLFGDKYYYVRWAFALPFILIVFSGRIRKNFPKLLWCWTFISILSIAWNPSIGGACALAALPMVLYEGIHEKGWKVFLGLKEKEVQKEISALLYPSFDTGYLFYPHVFCHSPLYCGKLGGNFGNYGGYSDGGAEFALCLVRHLWFCLSPGCFLLFSGRTKGGGKEDCRVCLFISHSF